MLGGQWLYPVGEGAVSFPCSKPLKPIPIWLFGLPSLLVALPDGENAGLVAYDLGKETADSGIQLLRGGHVLTMTDMVVGSAIGSIKLRVPDDMGSSALTTRE